MEFWIINIKFDIKWDIKSVGFKGSTTMMMMMMMFIIITIIITIKQF